MSSQCLAIATAQYPADLLPSLGAYRDKLARWVAEAVDGGGQLLVFPEYGAMEWAGALGVSVAQDLTASLQGVSDAMGEMDAALADLARRHGVHILGPSGPHVREGGQFANAARLFAPSGRVGVQDKMIMTPFERDWGIAPGAQLRVFETAIGRIGIAICYDSEFPLLVRAQAEAGARLTLVPTCTEFPSGFHRVRTAALARALENTSVSVLSPIIGDAPWSPAVDRNYGAGGIYVPAERTLSDTGIVAEGSPNVPGWIYGSVDFSRLEALAADGEMRNRSDWSLQPGAKSAAAAVEIVSLL